MRYANNSYSLKLIVSLYNYYIYYNIIAVRELTIAIIIIVTFCRYEVRLVQNCATKEKQLRDQ